MVYIPKYTKDMDHNGKSLAYYRGVEIRFRDAVPPGSIRTKPWEPYEHRLPQRKGFIQSRIGVVVASSSATFSAIEEYIDERLERNEIERRHCM